MNAPGATTPTLEVTMPTTTFTATVMAGTAEEAVQKVAKRAAQVDGFSVTGQVQVRSERHLLWNVEVAREAGADVNDAWVWFTSFGITPGEELGSVWQTVEGVGC